MSTGPLDMSKDPDRYDPNAEDPHEGSVRGGTLPELIGKSGAQEEERNNYVWLAGLLSVLLFLGLVAFVFAHLSPS